MRIYRHGDILLKEIGNIRKKLREVKTNILAHGESGNCHCFKDGQVRLLTDVESMTTEEITIKFVEILEASQLTHAEHKTITVLPGNYEIVREREYDYFADEIARMRD